MEQARKSKREAAGAKEAVVEEEPVPVDSDEDVNLRTRLTQRKMKVPAGSSKDLATIPTGLRVSEVVTATGMSVGDHIDVPSKRTKVVASASGEARQSKLSRVSKEAQLKDEGFL
jgi:hypothetical protein